ncbi:MAG: ATP-binding protein [Phycisphaeraceae bacterium]|nr:ATP-binding protein [Phycisphaeraceae bacterium]
MSLFLAGVETTNQEIEEVVAQRTNELEEQKKQLVAEIQRSKQLQDELVHAQKMESIGQLAAGIAHEINTPIQYIGDNTRFAAESYEGLFRIVDEYAKQLDPTIEARPWQERAQALQQLLDDLDIEFLKDEIPKAMAQSLEGVKRVSEIVQAMKSFSHPGGEKSPADLNKAIESTVTVCKNRWKYVAEVDLQLDESLPPVPCFVSEINQVILNLVVNAADAIAEANKNEQSTNGLITVTTRRNGDWAEICVSDTGTGIPDEVQRKIFDPFFTTKAVGSGTGQGLSISHDVVVNKHNGTIKVDSEPGEGTTFYIRLPLIEQSLQTEREAA